MKEKLLTVAARTLVLWRPNCYTNHKHTVFNAKCGRIRDVRQALTVTHSAVRIIYVQIDPEGPEAKWKNKAAKQGGRSTEVNKEA
jgi:hypothetical protein